jgi:hypothetical protein
MSEPVAAMYRPVRKALEIARATGTPFETAWESARQEVRRAEREVLDGTPDGWERAYVGAPPSALEALLPALAAVLGDDPSEA